MQRTHTDTTPCTRSSMPLPPTQLLGQSEFQASISRPNLLHLYVDNQMAVHNCNKWNVNQMGITNAPATAHSRLAPSLATAARSAARSTLLLALRGSSGTQRTLCTCVGAQKGEVQQWMTTPE